MTIFKNSLHAILIATTIILASCSSSETSSTRKFNDSYTGEHLNRVAFPIGGMGAGMFCMEGNGCISHMSIRHKPEVFNEPFMFGAISVKGLEKGAKVLEGPVQDWKVFGNPKTANGGRNSSYGFPRFENASFTPKFPFASVKLQDNDIPLNVSVKGWSPFIPLDADNSSLPVGAFEYTFTNTSGKDQEMVFSYSASNFMKVNLPGGGSSQKDNTIIPFKNGYILHQKPRIELLSKQLYDNSVFYTQTSNGSLARGLKVEYFDNMELKGVPKLTRTEQNVNKEWVKLNLPNIPSTQMSIRWTGKIKVDKTAKYQIAVSGDDGYKLWINEKLIIDNWFDHGEQTMIELVDLEGGKLNDVKLEFYQNHQGAAIRFGYEEYKSKKNQSTTTGSFAIYTDEPDVVVDPSWFKGGWFDGRTVLWKDIANGNTPSGAQEPEAEGGSLYVPFTLKNGESKTIKLMFAWYVPSSNLQSGIGPDDKKECCPTGGDCDPDDCSPYYKPWYAKRFKDINEIIKYWQINYNDLKEKSELFSTTFYDTNLPEEVIEAVAANLTILKSPTVLRQYNGKLWAWEGCSDNAGCCPGSCTHVWNYAQAICHLFPDMERSLRESEFTMSQNTEGHQTFRTPLPIRPVFHDFYAAADGQLGGIMKIYRDWRISGDNDWLKKIYPDVKQSFWYCSKTWDPKQKGILEEPHHNTYDIEFWGPDGMCTSFYLGALKAMIEMAGFMGEDVSAYEALLAKGTAYMESNLWNGEYFIQEIKWKGLEAPDPTEVTKGFMLNYTEEAKEILAKEGPKYQYGTGCLSDGILGCWMASMSSLDDFIDKEMMKSHLLAVHQYNLKNDLSDHANPQRPTYGMGKDGGLLLCTWPKGSELTLPFVYSNEVWTGIEYQVAAHLMEMGAIEEGLDIVRAVRNRYDGRIRNPFNEYECGHWYARAMASYGMLQGLTGVFYDAVDQTLYIDSQVGDNFKSFLSTATGWGNVGLKNGKPYLEVKQGEIFVKKVIVSGKEMTL